MRNVRIIPLLVALFILGWACGPVTHGDAATAAESAYTAALLRCVDQAKTLAESRTCRQRVNADWQITEVEAGR